MGVSMLLYSSSVISRILLQVFLIIVRETTASFLSNVSFLIPKAST